MLFSIVLESDTSIHISTFVPTKIGIKVQYGETKLYLMIIIHTHIVKFSL